MLAEVMVAMMDGSQPEAMVVAPKVAAQPVLPAAQESTPIMGRTEGVMAEGPSDTAVAVEGIAGELSLALTSRGSHLPMWDEPLLWWVSPQDQSSKLFTLDDATKGMEPESLNEGITAKLEALNKARGAL